MTKKLLVQKTDSKNNKNAIVLSDEKTREITKTLNDPNFVREELKGLAILSCSPETQYKK